MPGQSFRGFAERVALVTGGARGIGRAVALQLALEGAFVIVAYAPDDAEGARVATELREMGTLAHAVAGDVGRAEDVSGVFSFVEETFGRLDLLVNAASISRVAALDALAEDDWDAVLNLTLKGAFLCSQAAARLMKGRPSAAIVNIAAEAGMTGTGSVNAVAASAGLIGLTKALAREFAPRVRVNCVVAGEVDAGDVMRPRAATNGPEQASANEATRAPSRLLAPDEVARACVYLLSPEAASITGQSLVVGGCYLQI
ncbi:MAG TPA: SDR family oxidoreductase [Pyrinomonadaceae bacterium]|jgi:3-oxoacyl-[acyl-carrier protein] reductase|nr:SDR family oxidoreductase [Pyrinomonadaceae bacterium]